MINPDLQPSNVSIKFYKNDFKRIVFRLYLLNYFLDERIRKDLKDKFAHMNIMPLYILVTKLQNPELVEKRKEKGERFLSLVREKVPDIKWIAHYAILGPYDFLDIFEAKDEQEAAKVSLLSRT
ncbi:MAG: GYD domain-containing protein, partial [Promethearchaeota archaeon]